MTYFYKLGQQQALVTLGLEKEAVITPALQILSPMAYRAASGLGQATAAAAGPLHKSMQRLGKHLEQRASQKATKKLQEAAMKAQPGPHPGTVQLGDQVVSSKALESLLGHTPIKTAPAAASLTRATPAAKAVA